MEATILDLRYKMKDVLKALERREKIQILYHGKVKGTIMPLKAEEKKKVSDHPFFGSDSQKTETVNEVMENLRAVRYNDI